MGSRIKIDKMNIHNEFIRNEAYRKGVIQNISNEMQKIKYKS